VGITRKSFKRDTKKILRNLFKKNTKTKTITSTTPKIPIGGIIGMTLTPLSAGKGSSVIDPETGINKYTGEKRKNIFSN
jgi:hypothetical protein